jgi:nicotinamide riboside kinase
MNAFKIAFVGSHGVGKTTLCYGLAARLKASDVSLDVVGEIARRCPLPINRETTLAAQAWILHTQIAEEILASARYEVVICDRSVLDNFVYLLLSTGPQPTFEALVDSWLGTYDLLVRVPIVADPRADGLRSTDPSFQNAVDERLAREVAARDLGILDLTGVDRADWLDRVEDAVKGRLRPEQLELL